MPHPTFLLDPAPADFCLPESEARLADLSLSQDSFKTSWDGTLMERPPMEHPSDIYTCIERPLNNWSSVTIVPCYIFYALSQHPSILHPPPPPSGWMIYHCNIMSTLSYLDCDVLSICGQPAQNCAILSFFFKKGSRELPISQALSSLTPLLG
jgi:hypothetical protein